MITPIYAALLGLFLVFLSIHTIKGLRKFGVALGDAAHNDMKRRIRAHGNLAEYAPIFLIMLGYAELGNLPLWAVHTIGILFTAGRLMHAYSLLKAEHYADDKLTANPVWRIRGMICTFNCIGLLAVVILVQSLL